VTLWHRVDGYMVTDDASRLDIDRIHRWLSEDAYWAGGRTRDTVVRSIEHSVTFGAYYPGAGQVGFCRWVTDQATFAWLCDVYVDPSARGKGLGSWMVEIAVEHPTVRDVPRQLLATADAHRLYAKVGFVPLPDPGRWMWRQPYGEE